ncbi:hypothetical protein GCM10010129_59730 [Streptomyces fumigatiscleroticus]|nr:hypothetical protein GCM10010129_59730 [Streptomyces fumigatiscleroticus]
MPPDDLARLALDGPDAPPSGNSAEALAHAAVCTPCGRALAELRGTVAIARSATAEDEVIRPPLRVWQAVLGELRGPGRALPLSGRLLLAAVTAALLVRRWRRCSGTASPRRVRQRAGGGRRQVRRPR